MGMEAIPVDLLELILLFVVSPVFLVRAASTCRRWRRIIAEAGFLRRFRRLHRPPVAGYYYDSKRFVSTSPPSVVDGRHFSLDFLPGDDLSAGVWTLKDSRGSLLLLEHYNHDDGSRDMVICEPVTKRFRTIPPSTESARYGQCYSKAFLLDGDNVEPGGNSMSNFRVLCLVDGSCIHAGVFSSWRESWQETSMECETMKLIGLAMGSIYWYTGGRNVVALDQSSAEFSSFTLPGVEDWDGRMNQHRLAVTDARDGRVRVVVGLAGGEMKVFARQQGGGCEWLLEEMIHLLKAIPRLPWSEPWYFNQLPLSNHRTGAVLITTTRVPLSPRRATPLMFRLDIETMAVECMPDPNMGTAYPCELPWPPVFRARTDDHGDRAS